MSYSIHDFPNLSNAYNSRALFQIDGHEKLQFWVKTWEVPSIDIAIPSTTYLPYDLNMQGQKITFSQTNFEVYVDEFLTAYKDAYTWLTRVLPGETSDISKTTAYVFIFDNAFNTIIATFTFYDVMLKSISNLQYNNFGSEHLTMSLGIAYNNFVPNIKN